MPEVLQGPFSGPNCNMVLLFGALASLLGAMQWVAVAMAWLIGTFWGGLYELPVARNANAQNATVIALLVSFTTLYMPSAVLMELIQYGYPLPSYVTLALSISNWSGRFTANDFYHDSELSTSNSTAVVRLNVYRSLPPYSRTLTPAYIKDSVKGSD